MGSCVSKPSNDIEGAIVKTSPTKIHKVEEESKRGPKSSLHLTRKNLKQKKAVIDVRIRNDESEHLNNGEVIDKKKTQIDIKLIKLALSKHFIFSSLTDPQIDLIISHMKLHIIASGETLFEQSSKGYDFYIVMQGRLEIIVNGNRVNIAKEGDSFGELALIHDAPRSAGVKAISNASLWVLDRKSFRTVLEELNANNYKENKAFIESVPLFQILSPGQKDSLVTCLTSLRFAQGQKIVNEGDPGELLFIIKEGTVSCSQKGKEIRAMTKGDFFGEQALLYGSARTATVTATSEVTCVALNREELASSLGASLQHIVYRNSMKIAFEQNARLKKLTKQQTESLISGMQIQSFEENQPVIAAGSARRAGIYVVLKGGLGFAPGAKAQCKVFDVLGEADLIEETAEVFQTDFYSVEETDIAFISESGFFNAIGGEYSLVTNNNEAVELLKRIQLFRGLSPQQLQLLASLIKVQEYEDGDMIVEQNNPGDCFFIIKSGKVNILKDGVIVRNITMNDYFGERSLLFENFRSASVMANKKVVCWVLYRSEFLEILNENIRKKLLERIELQDDSIGISDLNIVKTLGSGMFGHVFLTVHKTKRSLYALKTVDRRKIAAYEIEENIVLERKILLQLDHVLIVKLVRTFKDSKRLYFLMEYICGMDLFDVLRKLDLLKECDARFYIACIFTIIEHLHERHIIYRDLKPENMVVDSEGYPRLIDFGTSKFVSGRTYTIVGTPHYMAPEIITGHGYGLAADYWTVGVMLFEFMFGYVPFGENETDPYAIYESIQERRLVFPKWVDNKNKVKEFINQLLAKNPAGRLGGNFDNLKIHPWFVGLNWDKIISKELRPPYIPKISPLEQEINHALNQDKNIDGIITALESKDEIQKNKRHVVVPPGWDKDF